MSQSDYIEYKKRAIELKRQQDLPPVLTQDDYIAFKQFSLENMIVSTNQTNNELLPAGTKIIFDLTRSNTTSCATFLCDPATRINRVPMRQVYFEPVQPRKYRKDEKTELTFCCTNTTKKAINNANTAFTQCRLRRVKGKIALCNV